jgi:hypothetical protein
VQMLSDLRAAPGTPRLGYLAADFPLMSDARVVPRTSSRSTPSPPPPVGCASRARAGLLPRATSPPPSLRLRHASDLGEVQTVLRHFPPISVRTGPSGPKMDGSSPRDNLPHRGPCAHLSRPAHRFALHRTATSGHVPPFLPDQIGSVRARCTPSSAPLSLSSHARSERHCFLPPPSPSVQARATLRDADGTLAH